MASSSNVNSTTMLPSTAPLSDSTAATNNYEGGLVFVVLSCLCVSLWSIYITFYHSRVMGYILTRLVNFKYIKNGQYFKIGKFIQIIEVVCGILGPKYSVVTKCWQTAKLAG